MFGSLGNLHSLSIMIWAMLYIGVSAYHACTSFYTAKDASAALCSIVGNRGCLQWVTQEPSMGHSETFNGSLGNL